ncbi:MAG: WD40 repeat domain-containing protein, partial [Armatimonadetes bacterium]|nr:WD40 repeat domain-containing protein [Armatimonadota bacterium]
MRLFRTTDGELLGADTDYANQSHGVNFSPTGDALVTTCDDGFIRRYTVSGIGLRLTKKAKATNGKEPYSVRFSPDGTRLAIGYDDTFAISVLSATNLAPRPAPNVSGVTNGDSGTVCWSADGRFLYAGGKANKASGQYFLRRWSDGGAGAFVDLPAADNT